jgi:hypothetical protein
MTPAASGKNLFARLVWLASPRNGEIATATVSDWPYGEAELILAAARELAFGWPLAVARGYDDPGLRDVGELGAGEQACREAVEQSLTVDVGVAAEEAGNRSHGTDRGASSRQFAHPVGAEGYW